MKLKTILATSLLAIFLAGCTELPDNEIDKTVENGGAYNQEIKVDEEKEPVEEKAEDKVVKENVSEVSAPEKEEIKLLSIYKMDLESDNFEKDLDSILEKTHFLGGYVSSNTVEKDKSSDNLKKSTLSIKVPKDKANNVIDFLKENFSVKSEIVSTVDITETYSDVDSKITNLAKQEERLRELYDRTDNVEEMITIDEKLFQVSDEKEKLMKDRLKMNDRMQFTKIDLTLSEVKSIEKEKGEISKALSSSFNTIGNVLSGTLVIIIKVFPAIFFSFLLTALLLLILFAKNKYNKNRNK